MIAATNAFRDIVCNRLGREAVSIAVGNLSYLHNPRFLTTCYADIVTNDSYVGKHDLRYDNLSLSRNFDAGDTVQLPQPETSFLVLSRIVKDNGIELGWDVDPSTFGTYEPEEYAHDNNISPPRKKTCWIHPIQNLCLGEKRRQIRRALGTPEDGVEFAQSLISGPPRSGIFHGGSKTITNEPKEASLQVRSTTSSGIYPAGIFIATATPIPTSGASQVSFRLQSLHRRQLPYQVGNRFQCIAQEANTVKYGLIGGIAGVAGLLLL